MDELWRLVEAARGSDRAGFPRAAEAVWRRANYSYLWLTEDTGEVIATMDALCDKVFPLSSMDLVDIADHPDPLKWEYSPRAMRGAELTEWEKEPVQQSFSTPKRREPVILCGSDLIDTPAVAAALARAPEEFPMLVDNDQDSLSHEDVCAFLHVGSGDRMTWEFSFTDEIKSIVDTGPDILADDVLEAHLAAHPDMAEAIHADREWFELKFTREMQAEEVLAICIDALAEAHRDLARHLRG